jgi:hypothetical protein
MTILLSDGTDTVELPDDLNWSDEFAWSAAEQSITRSLTGAVIFQTAERMGGRPITLQPPASGGWMRRADLADLKSFADVPNLQMTLLIRHTNYTVKFRHHEPPALSAQPVRFIVDPDGDEYVTPTIKLITV